MITKFKSFVFILFVSILWMFILSWCDEIVVQNNSNSSDQSIDNSTENKAYSNWRVVVFWWTYCPHCNNAMPEFKEEIYQVYKNDLDIFVQVVDWYDWKRFNIDWIDQWYEPWLTFESLANKECWYVPSWVVVDGNWDPVMSSCGSDKSMSDMENAIKSIIN